VPNGETTIFVYDASGKMVAEYSTIVAAPADAKTSYLTNDHLGSPRITTDAVGKVTSRRDFHPFGEEIQSGIGGRNSAQGYGGQDLIRRKFTGYERDIESDLDYAQARYYSSKLGRFYSVDPEGAGAYEENPQSWNAYAYVGNNPLNFTDPDGEKWKVCDNQGNCIEISDAEANRTLFNRKGNHPEIIRKDGKIFDEDGNVADTYVRTSFDDLSDEGNALIFGPNSIGEQGKKKGIIVGVLAGGAVVTGAVIGVCTATGGVPCAAAATTVVAAANRLRAPQRVRDTLTRIKQNNGLSPSGYKGGRTFKNDGRGGGQTLPKTDSSGRPVTYKEYDVNLHTPGVNRGGERIVRGSDGSSYYTNDHYKTFTKIE
jgi:RHS repeat-associated protein